MHDIDTIMGMLDWNESIKTQQQGVELAKHVISINAFILPCNPGSSKNVWENCARVLVDKPDSALQPYLTQLIEWLEDMNWPGALIIRERLNRFSEGAQLSAAVEICVKRALVADSEMWIVNMAELLENGNLKASLPGDISALLQRSCATATSNENFKIVDFDTEFEANLQEKTVTEFDVYFCSNEDLSGLVHNMALSNAARTEAEKQEYQDVIASIREGYRLKHRGKNSEVF